MAGVVLAGVVMARVVMAGVVMAGAVMAGAVVMDMAPEHFSAAPSSLARCSHRGITVRHTITLRTRRIRKWNSCSPLRRCTWNSRGPRRQRLRTAATGGITAMKRGRISPM